MIMKRKGVSPVIAELMMTAITVVLGVGILFWGMNTLSMSGQSIIYIVSEEEARLREALVVEHIIFFYDNNSLTLYVRNIGDIEVVLSSLFIMDYNVSSPLEKVSLEDRGITILIGDMVSFNVQVSTPLIKGHIYMIKLVSDRGVSYVSMVKAT